MSAAAILRLARADGLDLRVDGDSLVLEANVPPPQAILDGLAHHKQEILDLLRPGRDGWSAEDWKAYFDERAGIAEFDGGLPRPEAEARAIECCIAEYINRTHTGSDPDICAHCGGPEVAKRPLIPIGTDGVGHVWLHFECHEVWQRARHSDAITTLQKLGLGKQ